MIPSLFVNRGNEDFIVNIVSIGNLINNNQFMKSI